MQPSSGMTTAVLDAVGSSATRTSIPSSVRDCAPPQLFDTQSAHTRARHSMLKPAASRADVRHDVGIDFQNCSMPFVAGIDMSAAQLHPAGFWYWCTTNSGE